MSSIPMPPDDQDTAYDTWRQRELDAQMFDRKPAPRPPVHVCKECGSRECGPARCRFVSPTRAAA